MSKFNSVLPNLGKISQLLFPALPAPIFVAQVGEANPKTDKVDSAVSSSEIKDKANSEFQRTFVIQSKKGSAIELYYFDGKENKKIQLPIRDNLSFYDKDLGQIERKTTSVAGETVYTYTFNVSKAYGTKGEGLGLKLEQKEYLLSVKASGESAIKAQALDLTKPLLTNSKIELSSFLNVDLNPRGQRNTFPEYPNVTFDAPRYSPKGLFKLGGELVSVGTAEHETVHAVNGFIYNNAESLFGVHANVVKSGKFSFSGIEAVYLGEGKATFVKVPGFYMEKSATGEERLHGHRLSIHDLARSIPQEIRGKKYDTYFRDRIHMKDSHSGSDLYRTTYVLDEFSAYVRDAKCSLEHYDWYVKTKSGVVAEFHGAGEFVGYGMSLVKLIHDNPDQYKTDQDRDHAYKVIGYLMQEGAALYKEGLNEKKYPRLQSAHADFLVKLQKQKSLVDVAKKVYGEAWVESLFSRE